MNFKFSGLIAGVSIVALSSCSAYKSGQTPDDVYYSPGKPVVVAAKTDNEYLETNPRSNYSSRNNYNDPSYRDDQYMRMMIASGRRSMYYNDFAMMDPWMANNWRWNSYMTWNSGFNSPWNSMFYWNSFYNPYYGPTYPSYIGKTPTNTNWGYSAPRPSRPVSAFSMSSYLNTNGTSNRSGYRTGTYYGGSYNNSNSTGNYNPNRRSLFNNSESRNSNNSVSDRPDRSYSPSNNSNNSSNSGSRSSSGSSGGGGGTSRPTRTSN